MSSTRKRPRIIIPSENNVDLIVPPSMNGDNTGFTGNIGKNFPRALRNPETGVLHPTIYPPEHRNLLKGRAYSAANTVYNPKYKWPRITKSNRRLRGNPEYNGYFRQRERHSSGVRNHGNWKIHSPLANSPARPPGFGGSRTRKNRNKQ